MKRLVLVAWLLAPAGASRAAASPAPPALPADTLAAWLARPGLPDTLRVQYLCRLSQQQQNVSLATAAQSATQALALARRSGYVGGQLAAQFQVGNCY